MGLKKKNATITRLGIVVPDAYAQIDNINIGLDGECHAVFKIQTSRESMDKPALETISINTIIDKSSPVHKQIYEYAKSDVFAGWEDDII